MGRLPARSLGVDHRRVGRAVIHCSSANRRAACSRCGESRAVFRGPIDAGACLAWQVSTRSRVDRASSVVPAES